MFRSLFWAVSTIAVMFVTPVWANAFDDCVLENMRGATSDVAAKSIKVACLRKNSVVLSEDEFRGLRPVSGSYGTYGFRNTPGFTVDLKNDTGYIITEVTFAISIAGGQSELFRVDDFFYQEPGVIYTGLPPDPTVQMRIDPGTSKKFQFSADRPEIDKKKKWNWSIVGAKGIVTR
jgi:hypothetical protein